MDERLIIQAAMVCHAANREWCLCNGDDSQKEWENAEEWQRESAIAGVRFAIANPNAPDSAQHDAWVRDKVAAGWVYGEVKNATTKTHPCIMPFDQLSPFQQRKDRLFKAVVAAICGAHGQQSNKHGMTSN